MGPRPQGRGRAPGSRLRPAPKRAAEADKRPLAQAQASGRDDFDAFAAEQVGAQMDAALKSEAESVREAQLMVEAAQQYEGAEMALARDLGRAPTPAELAKKLEWTRQRTDQIGEMVDEARRIHDEELLQYLDPDALEVDDEEAEDG